MRPVERARESEGGANAEDARKGADTWLSEFIWREFYIAILHYFPHVRGGNFRREFNGIPWRNDDADFAAWCEGRTGYPIVDAAMRQMVAEGWMHNRCRMITASFLVKDLLIDWRLGERFFMQHLVDGDPAPNNGGWQWTAGTGTDAAPYFRVFNPVVQGQKFDPDRQLRPSLAARVAERAGSSSCTSHGKCRRAIKSRHAARWARSTTRCQSSTTKKRASAFWLPMRWPKRDKMAVRNRVLS